MLSPSGKVLVRKRGKWLDVLTVRRGHALGVIVVGGEPVAVNIHFHERSYLCAGDDDCPMCSAGCGRQAIVFVGVWCKKQMGLVRMAYTQSVVDTLTLGWEGEISVKKVGASYHFEPWGVRDTGERKVTSGQILQRVMILHKLEPTGEQLQSGDAMWKENLDKIRRRAALAAVFYRNRNGRVTG